VDDVRVYNRVLTEAQIRTDMNTPVGSKPTPDTTPPTVAITTPTSTGALTTSKNSLSLGGTAADNIQVTQVSWTNSLGGNGTATGTTKWSVGSIALKNGTNVITVTARDANNNTATATLSATYIPSPGLVAAYNFDEGSGTNSADVSGNGHPATLIGGPTWVPGHSGTALSFNGQSSYASTNLATSLPAWTISTWVRSPAPPTNAAASGPIQRQANYQINWNHPSAALRGAAAVRVAGVLYPASFGPLAANTWYHLSATYDGETLKAYKNGNLITSNTAPSGSPSTNSNPFTIAKNAALDQFFQGIVDDVRVYNRVLTQAQIRTDMYTPVGGSKPTPDTTPPTVAITSPTTGTTVSGRITVTANAADNIGVTGVQFFLDEAQLGMEATSPPFATFWDTEKTNDGSHQLAARARDAAGNHTTTVVAINILNDPTVVGRWSLPINFPTKAVHMVLLPTFDVLMWDAFGLGREAYVWNSSTGTFTYVPSPDNLFCAGLTLLVDGNALVVGGHLANGGVGLPDANRFDPVTKSWSAVAPMAFGRWYPTSTTLPDGRVLVVSGAVTCYTCTGDIPEVYDPTTDSWTQLANAELNMPLYPHMYVLPDGRILYASSSENVTQTQTLDLETESWTMIDPLALPGGSSAMYRPGVILKSGSPGAPNRLPAAPSLATAYVLDMNQLSPAWRPVASMAFARTFHTLTLLPNGNVLATGGSQTNEAGSQPVLAPEIWNAQNETWSTMSNGQMARTYHQTALLLPDGRVLVAGSGGCCGAPSQFNGEIFSPPYLFKGPRPIVASAPANLAYGSQFMVGTPDAPVIQSVALIRLGAVTHQIDQNQRYVPLSFTAAADELVLQMPASASLAPPGDYMLFIVNSDGVPSVANLVRVE
jgi:hypothetical protein